MKRGQVTIFIIIGIIALIAIVLVLYTQSEFLKSFIQEQQARLSGIPQEFQPVKEYSKNCLDLISHAGIDLVLYQGGYLYPEDYIPIPGNYVSIWYYKKDLSPNLKIIEREISKFINDNFNECLFEYPDDSYTFDPQETSSFVKIEKGKISINLNQNVLITYKNLTYNLQGTKMIINKDITKLFNDAKQIIQQEVGRPGKINLKLLDSLESSVEMITIENGIVYSLYLEDYNLMMGIRLR